MNNGRFASIYNGLQQNLKKVYDVVPIREAWGESMVMAELSRLGMSYSGDKPIIGMLNRLKDLGLIKEMEPGKFLREPITEKVEKKEPKPATIESKDHMIKETKTPIAQLNDLAMQAIQIANLCKKLAGDIETAAINIDDHVAFTQKDSLKLKQLQELLKG